MLDLDYLSARQYVYLVLQRLFGTEPTMEVLDAIGIPVLRQALEVLLEADGETLPEATGDLLCALADAQSADVEDRTRQLACQYVHCFVGPENLPAPPFESVYADRRRILLTETTLRVRKTYQASGYQPQLLQRVPDDHVALELDFISALAQRAFSCANDGDETTAREYLKTSLKFLNEHLGTWVQPFARAVKEKASAPFYEAAADVLEQCVLADRSNLSQMGLIEARDITPE